MKMRVLEVDESGEEQSSFDDTYALEPVFFSINDYMNPQKVPNGEFTNAWEKLATNPSHVEIQEIFSVGFPLEKGLKSAVDGVVKFFGLEPCENSDQVDPTSKSHNLFLAGSFGGKIPVLIRAQIGFNQQYGCVLKLHARTMNQLVLQMVLSCIE